MEHETRVEPGERAEGFRDIDHAMSIWRQGIERFPDDYAPTWAPGEGLLRAYRASAALPYLERAVSMRPEDERARKALATALARTNH